MRRSSEINRVLLASLLASVWMPLALQSEEPTSGSDAFRRYAVERAHARPSVKPASSYDLDFDLAFPKAEPQPIEQPSSRRQWASGMLFPSEGNTPPGFFVPDVDRPIKPLAGEFAGNPIRAADHIENYRRPWNVLINDLHVVPVGAEEPLDEDCPDLLPRSGVKVCEAGKAKPAETANEVEHGEAAKVILELMETLGRSVLDGTVFQKPTQDEQQWLKDLSADGEVSPREALIKYIRHLEAVEAKARMKMTVCEEETECLISFGAGRCECECSAKCAPCKSACAAQVAACSSKCQSPCECHEECACSSPCGKCTDCPVACGKCAGCTVKVLACSDSADLAPDIDPGAVEVLRDMAAHLDMASNELERREMYSRADQLRDLAGNLRQDARKVSVARTAHKGPCLCLPQPPQDVHTQLRQLQEELMRTRAELEQARGLFYPPHPTNR